MLAICLEDSDSCWPVPLLFACNRIKLCTIYDKPDYFDFKIHIVNFPFFDGDVPRSLSYGFIFCNLFVLRKYVLMLVTSTTEPIFDC